VKGSTEHDFPPLGSLGQHSKCKYFCSGKGDAE